MAFQTSVPAGIVSGFVGEIAIDGPSRCLPAQIALDAVAADCIVARAYTYDDETAETVRPGGTGQFAGILISPKAHPRLDLGAETLAVLPGSVVELLQMGYVFVQLASAGGTIGSTLVYHTTTGALDWTDTPETPPASHAVVPGAVLDRHLPGTVAPRLALAKLTN